MTHTAKEEINIYKEKHSQFQPKRTDAEDWEETTQALMKKPKAATEPELVTLP